MIVWREKFLAAAIHFLATLALAACAAALIFLVWFPHPFATMIGGTELFLLVVGCDLALGPLLSLVIYNSAQVPPRADHRLLVIGAVQIAALVYGVFIVAGTRPVYVAFSMDRLEVVTARDISDAELAAAQAPVYGSLPLTGPRFVAIEVPAAEHNDAMFRSRSPATKNIMRPRFYVPYESQLEQIRARAKTLDELEKSSSGQQAAHRSRDGEARGAGGAAALAAGSSSQGILDGADRHGERHAGQLRRPRSVLIDPYRESVVEVGGVDRLRPASCRCAPAAPRPSTRCRR